MRATDKSPTRFDAALASLQGMLAAGSANPNARVSVVLAGPEARVEIARQSAATEGVGLAGRVRASDGTADWTGTARLVSSLVRADETTDVVVLTDGADAGANALAGLPNVKVSRSLFAGSDTTNVGLTAAITPINAGEGEWTVDGTLRFSGPTPDKVTVEFLYQPVGATTYVSLTTTDVSRAPQATEATFRTALRIPGAGSVKVQIPADAGPFDDAVEFGVRREGAKTRVLYLGAPTGPLLAALQAIDNVDLIAADTLPGDDNTYDLAVVDNVAVTRRPATNTL